MSRRLINALKIAMRDVKSDATLSMCRQAIESVEYGPDKLYREEVLRTCNPEFLANFRKMVSNAGLGVAGEAGEVADIAKKFLHHEHRSNQTQETFDAKYKAKMIKELGDVRWYLELMCHAVGTSIEEVERANSNKLRERFPVGFTPEAATARVDVKSETAGPKAAESAMEQFEKKQSSR